MAGLRDLDDVVDLCTDLGRHGLEHQSDCAWNFRNEIVPYQPGDPLYMDDEGEYAKDVEPRLPDLERLIRGARFIIDHYPQWVGVAALKRAIEPFAGVSDAQG